MDSQQDIRALMTAGKTDEVTSLISREADAAASTYAGVREDDTRTDEAKRRMLALAYVQRRRQVDERLAEMASKVVRTDRDDAERVFGVKGLDGDAASLAISRRDAADRVAGVTDRAELRELLRRATRTGDEVLARAVAEQAVEAQDVDVMQEFLADRPHLDTAGERLWNAKRATNDSLAVTMHLANLRPDELQGMASDAIEQLAQTEPSAAPREVVFARPSPWVAMDDPDPDAVR